MNLLTNSIPMFSMKQLLEIWIMIRTTIIIMISGVRTITRQHITIATKKKMPDLKEDLSSQIISTIKHIKDQLYKLILIDLLT